MLEDIDMEVMESAKSGATDDDAVDAFRLEVRAFEPLHFFGASGLGATALGASGFFGTSAFGTSGLGQSGL